MDMGMGREQESATEMKLQQHDVNNIREQSNNEDSNNVQKQHKHQQLYGERWPGEVADMKPQQHDVNNVQKQQQTNQQHTKNNINNNKSWEAVTGEVRTTRHKQKTKNNKINNNTNNWGAVTGRGGEVAADMKLQQHDV